MDIQSFSFRYGKNDGSMVWYRLERTESGGDVIVDRQEAKGTNPIHIQKLISMDMVQKLGAKLQEYNIEKWDGFCEFAACLCAGDGWALHIRNTDKTEIHAMGHSGYPKGFFESMEMLNQFFSEV